MPHRRTIRCFERAISLAFVVLVNACGSSSAAPGSNGSVLGLDAGDEPDVGVEAGAVVEPEAGDEPIVVVDSGACHATTAAHPIEGANHQPVCSPLTYQTNPPSSGDHYPYWAAYKTYTKPFLPGFWVHCLEHGAVVITYNCADGCPDEVARAQAFIDGLPNDCGDPPRRIVMLPDPDLDVRFAASAWGFTLKADCFDAPVFAEFVAAHYGHGTEAVCGDGWDPFTGLDGMPFCP